MAYIELMESRIERLGDRSFALFTLSAAPDAGWIARFEECLAKHSSAPVAVVDDCARVDLPHAQAFQRLVELVRRCIEEANFEGETVPA